MANRLTVAMSAVIGLCSLKYTVIIPVKQSKIVVRLLQPYFFFKTTSAKMRLNTRSKHGKKYFGKISAQV